MTIARSILRSLFHLSGIVLPLIYLFFSRNAALVFTTFLLCLVLFLEFLRIAGRFEIAGKFLKDTELKRPTGSLFYVIAALSVILLFSKDVALCSLFVLCISDPLSSVIGRSLGKHPLFGKSVEGTVAFFVSAVIILALLSVELFTAFASAAVATLTELFTPVFLDDNLTIPIATGVALTLLGP